MDHLVDDGNYEKIKLHADEAEDINFSDDGFPLVVVFALVSFFILLILTKRYGLAEFLIGHEATVTPTMSIPTQSFSQVYNPFVFSLSDKRPHSDGVTCIVTAHTPCWLGAYWGVKIADIYPIIHSHWSALSERSSLMKSLEEISIHQEEFELLAPSESKVIALKQAEVELGSPPRDRYPLVIILLDLISFDLPFEEIRDSRQIVCMTSLIHLKDEHCPADSHIFAQFVRTPMGRPYDMKQLYVTSSDSEEGASLAGNHVVPSVDELSASHVTLCIVCLTNEVERAILPCRHACLCNACCYKLLNCPVCRGFIVSTFLIQNLQQNSIRRL